MRLLSRRGLIGALLLVGLQAHAADPSPSAPIKLIVPFSASGATDAVARVVAQVAGERTGRVFIVDNRPGAGGSIGTTAAVQAPADGTTLLLGSNGTMVLNPLYPKTLKYDVDRDLMPVAGLASVPYVIASHPQFEGRDVNGLVATAKKRSVTFASPGNGTTNHLVGVLLGNMTRSELIHVPYRGAAPAMNDVVGGQVDFLSGDLGTLLPMITSGKLRALAVTGTQRVPLLTNVPTVAESGVPGFAATGWFGVFAPKGTPPEVVKNLSEAIGVALKDPRTVQRFKELGGTPMPMSPDDLRRLIATETTKWRKVITDNKVTADSLQ